MCGIFGVFFPRASTVKALDVTRVTAALRHRGPDDQGGYATADNHYQVGFRRLSIIDLDTGNQPIIGPGGRRVLVGNGEIYNYRELRARYADYAYSSSGDMEAALAAHEAEGAEFVHRLNGMYALSVYDRDAHRLLLVRDRLGVKPLYWARLPGGGLAFASEIKALFASGLIAPAIDEAAVSAYLAHGYVPAPATLFQGVSKLAPGCLLEITAAGDVRAERYWRAAPDPALPKDEAEIAEYLEALLADSLRLQMRSDVPVGALLSGGIDSGLMVAMASRSTDTPMRTFTMSFEGAPVDEAPLARMVAERYATDHEEIRLPARSAADCLPFLAWHTEEPLNDAALVPNYLIEQALGRHVKVALNGTGGDELFAGYGRYFQLPVERRFLSLPAPIRRLASGRLAGALFPMRQWQLHRAEKFETARGQYLHEHSCHFPPPIRRMLGNAQPPPPAAQQAYFGEFFGDPQTASLYADINTYLPEDLLTLLDRTSMAASVEGRVPFLDHRLVEAALAVPPEVRTPGGRQKGLQRRIAAAHLPEPVLNAPKRGFQSPVPAWLGAGLGRLAERLLTSREALARGWWREDGIRRLLAEPAKHGYRVYSLLMLELACRVHVTSPDPLSPPNASLEEFADAA